MKSSVLVFFFLLVVVAAQNNKRRRPPTASLSARVKLNPKKKNEMLTIQELMHFLPPRNQSSCSLSSRVTTASDYEFCMDKVPIYKRLIDKSFVPRLLKFFIINVLGFVVNCGIMIVFFVYLYRSYQSCQI